MLAACSLWFTWKRPAMKANEPPAANTQRNQGQHATEDASVARPPDHVHGTPQDPDHERSGGMGSRSGKPDPAVRSQPEAVRPGAGGDNRAKDTRTIPPSTPQGPASNDLLVSPEYRNGPYPGDVAGQPVGEGSTVATHSTGITAEGRKAEHEGIGPLKSSFPSTGEDKNKKEGTEKHEP